MQQWEHCVKIRKVAGSILGIIIIGIFHWHNSSDCSMIEGGYSASNRNEYQENFQGIKAVGA